MSRVHGILEGKERFKKSARLAAGKYSEKLLNAVDTALEFKPVDRPQTIQAWRQLLPTPPGFEEPVPEDDSGMDLLLIPDEEEGEEEETVVLSAPLIPQSPAEEEDEEEETVVLSAPLIPESPPEGDEGEEETVVSAGPLVQEPPKQPAGDDEETLVLGAPLVDTPASKGDEVIISSPGIEETGETSPQRSKAGRATG